MSERYIDNVVNSLIAGDNSIELIDLNKDANEVYVITETGAFTLQIKEGVPNEIKYKAEQHAFFDSYIDIEEE